MENNEDRPILLDQNRFDEMKAILEKYGKEKYNSEDTDISFDDAVRLEQILWDETEAAAKFNVAISRGLVDVNKPGVDY